MTIRILLVDDHTLFRSGLKALLSRQSDFEVVGEAADGLANGVEVPVSSLHSVSSQVNTGWCFAISIYSGTRNCSHYIHPKIFLKVFAELFSKSDPFPLYKSFAIVYVMG